MPNSQIEMVVMGDHPGQWKVCGDFTKRPDGRVDVYVVVRQGDVVAHGHDRVTDQAWQFEVVPEGGQLVAGDGKTAIASAVAIAKDSSGLETFTWAQRVPVQERRTDGNPPTELGVGEPAEPQGTLAMGDSISSSLAVSEPAGPEAAAGTLSWKHAFKVH
jgi:hypothetical protein